MSQCFAPDRKCVAVEACDSTANCHYAVVSHRTVCGVDHGFGDSKSVIQVWKFDPSKYPELTLLHERWSK